MVAPVVLAAGASAAGKLAGGIISARDKKKKRKQDAELEASKTIQAAGKDSANAIGGIVNNLRAALIRK